MLQTNNGRITEQLVVLKYLGVDMITSEHQLKKEVSAPGNTVWKTNIPEDNQKYTFVSLLLDLFILLLQKHEMRGRTQQMLDTTGMDVF